WYWLKPGPPRATARVPVATSPSLLKVSVEGAVVVPTSWLPKASDGAETVRWAGATPRPLSAELALPPGVPVTVKVASLSPATVGANTTSTPQPLAGARV